MRRPNGSSQRKLGARERGRFPLYDQIVMRCECAKASVSFPVAGPIATACLAYSLFRYYKKGKQEG